ncbi:MAG: tetratricopeptide repeat protein [Candidatus Hydrogenedentes bacterium]|nr:tetratricopeptide repeat protein [Candidatus Hydrogenedentota bacterium]
MALRNFGKLYFQKENYEAALKLFERLLKQAPLDYEANWLSAQCLEQLERPDDALERLHLLAQLAPQDDKVFRELGMVYLNHNGDPQTARRMFDRSMMLNPSQPELSAMVTQAPGVPEMPELLRFPELPAGAPAFPQPDIPQSATGGQVATPQLPNVPAPRPPGPGGWGW